MTRHRFDPLANHDWPHWLAVSDMQHALVECTAIPAGADLADVMKAAIGRLAADGWQAESNGRHGFLFAARGGARRFVNLTPVDPHAVGDAGHAYLAGSGPALS